MLNLLNLAQGGGKLLARGLNFLQQALQLGNVAELAGSELGQAGLGGVGNLGNAQIDGKALQVVKMKMEGFGVLLGQGLPNGCQVQLLRQTLDEFQLEIVVAHKPVHRVIHVHIVIPQDIQTALHLIHI